MWSNERGHTSHSHLYALIDSKHMVPDDVIDVFVLILLDSLKKLSLEFKRPTTVTRPMALALSRQERSLSIMDKMMAPAVEDCPIA